MDNFRPIIIALLLICCIGFIDTASLNRKIIEHKINSLYKNKTKILGFGLEDKGNYICVKDVLKGTPAERAGVLDRDIIVSLNYMEVPDVDKFKEAFEGIKLSEKIVLGVIRDGERSIKYLNITPRIMCVPCTGLK